jgi:hypothetical protein
MSKGCVNTKIIKKKRGKRKGKRLQPPKIELNTA